MSRCTRVSTLHGCLLTAITLVTFEARAGGIPYQAVGQQNNMEYNLVATEDGPVTAYFYSRSAAFPSRIGLSVNGTASPNGMGLDSNNSYYGMSFQLGNAHAGDTLVLRTDVLHGMYAWQSNREMGTEDLQHFYITEFQSDGFIPHGLLVQFEDLAGGGDFDYNDYEIVITNAKFASTPEPETAVLAGLAGAGAFLWTKCRRRPIANPTK